MDNIRIDKQVEDADKASRGKGVSFAMLYNNTLTYVNIPTTSHQRFVYFENTSKITNEEREKIRLENERIKLAIKQLKNE